MQSEWSDQYIIDRYLEGHLTEEEEAFLAMRMDDAMFMDKWSWMMNSKKTIDEKESPPTSHSNHSIQAHFNKGKNTGKAPRFLPRIIWIIPVIIFMILVYFMFRSGHPDTLALLDDFYSQYPNIIDPISVNETFDESSLSAFQLYESGRYHDAILLFDRIGDDRPESFFYKAMACIAVGRYKDALLTMDAFDVNPANELLHAAEWYRALVYIKTGDLDKARGLLAPISLANDHPFKNQASELMTYLQE